MGAVGEPLNSAGLILQGGQQLNQSLGQVAQQQKAEAEANSPISPDQRALMEEMIARVQGGEDPDKVAQEARRHPVMAPLFGGGQAQPQPQAGPQMALGGPQSPQQPRQAPALAPELAGPPQSAPRQSLGALGGGPSVGQPIQGAPQMTSPAAGASGLGTPNPRPDPTVGGAAFEMARNGPQNGGQPGGQMTPAGGRFANFGANTTKRQYAEIMPILQAMSTQQGRIQVAQTAAETRMQLEEMRIQYRQLEAKLFEEGRNRRADQNSGDKAEGRKTQEKIATARNETSITNTNTRATTSSSNADKYVAGGITRTAMSGQTSRDNATTRASGGGNKLTPEQQILQKEATQARDEAARLGRIGSLDQGPNYAAQLKAAQEKADALSAEVRATISPKAGGAIPQATIEDPSHPKAATATLVVTRNSDGATILIPPAQFDPAKYTKR